MNKHLLIKTFGWGFVLWLIGYLLGIALFMFVPPALLGWVLMPIGSAITIWVLWRKIALPSLQSDLVLAVIWTLIAISCDYLFLVLVFKPADGYYKLDVLIYYLLTFALPVVMGRWKRRGDHETASGMER